MPDAKRQAVINYYARRESRWGYKYLLKGTKHYGYYEPGRHISIWQAQRAMEEQIGKNLGLKEGAKVLDAGCGEGFVAMTLAKEFKYEVYGIDILDWSVASARKNAKDAGVENVEFSVQDYSKTDFPDNFFDGIYTIETFVHSLDFMKTLKEFRRILKPGGVLVNHEYVFDDELPPEEDRDWRVMYKGSGMNTYDDLRISKVADAWQKAGFEKPDMKDATKNMEPFMRRLYQVAFVPYYALKLFGKEKEYVNTFAGVRSYQLRHHFHYMMIRAKKPDSKRR